MTDNEMESSVVESASYRLRGQPIDPYWSMPYDGRGLLFGQG